jgi:hypothetical protein
VLGGVGQYYIPFPILVELGSVYYLKACVSYLVEFLSMSSLVYGITKGDSSGYNRVNGVA